MRKVASVLSMVMVFVVLLVAVIPAASFASTKGRRNTAYGLTAVTLYELIRGNPKTALVTGAGAAYAWKRYYDSKEKKYRYYKVPAR